MDEEQETKQKLSSKPKINPYWIRVYENVLKRRKKLISKQFLE